MFEFEPPHLSKHDQELAQRYGGADLNDYEQPTELNYCDKGNHKESSLFHQPNHLIYWKKAEKREEKEN